MRAGALATAALLLALAAWPAGHVPDAPLSGPPQAGAWSTLSQGSGPGMVPVLVGFQPGRLPAAAVGSDLQGFRVLQRTPQIGLLVLEAPGVALARQALLGPGVAYVEADGVMTALAVPDDPHYPGQYGPSLMGFPKAWDTAGYGSSSVQVAVIDSGVLGSHPDLQGGRILAGHDYVDGDATPNDACGHGTHVTGTIAASTNDGLGVAGMSQASVRPLKVLGSGCSGSFSNIAKAIVDATDQGARVISMSLGGTTADSATASAVAYAWDHGVTLVAAAGNSGTDGSVQYPAAYPQVIAVSAVDSGKALAGYSSYGAKVEVAAPGTGIDSTTVNGGYGLMSGTSMAAPHVAGALALALGCAPATTNTDLRLALDATAEDLGAAGRDHRYGYGLARADLLVARLCTPRVDQPPVASFTMKAAGLGVLLDASGSHDPDGDPVSLAWDFGDGTTGTGRNITHTYSQAGTYAINLTVGDGRLATSTAQSLQATSSTVGFTVPSNVNEWWVEVHIAANQPVAGVGASVNGAAPVPLVKQSWGNWARSFHVLAGSRVTFFATLADTQAVASPSFSWLGPPPSPAPAPQPSPPPAPQPQGVSFTVPSNVNEWWVEVKVTGPQPIAAVSASVEGGPEIPLTHASWGNWARSFHVAQGSQVRFTATDGSGAMTTSTAVTWLGAPATTGPFTATFSPSQTTNEWWIEVGVKGSHPVASVEASVDGGGWIQLPLTSWGAWAKSIHVLAGQAVVFRATDGSGASVTSQGYVWS